METTFQPVIEEKDIKILGTEEEVRDLIGSKRRTRREEINPLYNPLALDHTEPEHQGEVILPISSVGTENDPNIPAGRKVIPRGSALVTSSGNLATRGINQIIHAAPGSDTQIAPWGNPTRQGVIRSIQNSILLAERNNLRDLAIPFVGGSIFFHAMGITKEELARSIMEAAINQRDDELTVQRVIFVSYGAEDRLLFERV